MTVAHANLATLVQLLSPVGMRGRITAPWFVCWLGARPVGAVLIGTLADLLGTAVALLSVGLVVLATAVGALRVWRVGVAPGWRYRKPLTFIMAIGTLQS